MEKILKISMLVLCLLFTTGCSVCGTSLLKKISRGFDSEPGKCEDSTSLSSEVSVSVTIPTSSRTIWVDDEVGQRTLSFTYSGDSVSCSRDAGTTYEDCDSGSTLIWNVSDYSTQHIIKVENSAGESDTYTFTPSTQYPGVSFVTCDSEETGTNNEFDSFETAHLGVANKVICISDGVTIENSVAINDGDLIVGADNITIIARHGHTAIFKTTRGSGTAAQQSIFTLSGRSGVKFVGLKFDSDTGGSSWSIQPSTSSQDIEIHDSEFVNNNATGAHYSVYVTGSSGSTTPIKVKRSKFTMDEAKTAVFLSSGKLDLSNSTIDTKYRGLHASIGTTGTITDTKITCTSTDTTDYPVYNFRGDITVTNSTLVDGCGNGAIVINDNNASATSATIEGVTFKRSTNVSGNTAAAIVALNGGSGNSFNSSANQNLICNEPSSTEDFTAVSSGTFAGTWVDGNQLNGGVISDCSQ